MRDGDDWSEGIVLNEPLAERLGVGAGDEATDFGQLFLGFSIFLIISSLILMGLLFVFGVESRSEQVGMLLAVGLGPRLARSNSLMCQGV